MAFDKKELKQLREMFATQRTDIFSDTKNLLSPIKDEIKQLNKKVDDIRIMLEEDVSEAYKDIDKIKQELEKLKIKVAKLEVIKQQSTI